MNSVACMLDSDVRGYGFDLRPGDLFSKVLVTYSDRLLKLFCFLEDGVFYLNETICQRNKMNQLGCQNFLL